MMDWLWSLLFPESWREYQTYRWNCQFIGWKPMSFWQWMQVDELYF